MKQGRKQCIGFEIKVCLSGYEKVREERIKKVDEQERVERLEKTT